MLNNRHVLRLATNTYYVLRQTRITSCDKHTLRFINKYVSQLGTKERVTYIMVMVVVVVLLLLVRAHVSTISNKNKGRRTHVLVLVLVVLVVLLVREYVSIRLNKQGRQLT